MFPIQCLQSRHYERRICTECFRQHTSFEILLTPRKTEWINFQPKLLIHKLDSEQWHVQNLKAAKAELPLEGNFFPTQFPSLGMFINKKLEMDKTETT